MPLDPRIAGVTRLIQGAMKPAPGTKRVLLAVLYGAICHFVFAAAVLCLITAMFFGMSKSLGAVPWPWAAAANLLLLLQFPLIHSALLTQRGRHLLRRLIPGSHGATLSTTTYATIASLQLIALFGFWTPSGIVWWQAEGSVFWILCAVYASTWILLMKSSFDAGLEVQSGALGWMSLLAGAKPVYPDMPVRGLFRVVRQPIYAAFALTLWTVPVWTPDQLALALALSGYCLAAPLLKEKRFHVAFGDRFQAYCAEVPYMIPGLRVRTRQKNAGMDLEAVPSAGSSKRRENQ